MLDDYGFSYVWNYPASVDLNKFHMIFKERALDVFKAPVLQILLENHELCKYAKISLHIHIIVDLNKKIG